MLKSDVWIKWNCDRSNLSTTDRPMIEPFVNHQVRVEPIAEKSHGRKVISYGLGSYSYDIRLSPLEFYTFKRIPGMIVDPKNFDERCLEKATLQCGGDPNDSNSYLDSYFILPANTYGLGVSKERINMRKNVTGLVIGKSTYCRLGMIVNCSPLESEWEGHITLEFSNSSSSDIKLYANEGIAAVMFMEGMSCEVTYRDRVGKYMHQPESVVFAKV